jgi:hypothetical protein
VAGLEEVFDTVERDQDRASVGGYGEAQAEQEGTVARLRLVPNDGGKR